MSSVQWFIGVVIITCAIIANIIFPRYHWQVVNDPSSGKLILLRYNQLTGQIGAQFLPEPYLDTTRSSLGP